VVALSAYLAHAMTLGDRRVFLPGETSAGHHQIEERCELCHSESFADADSIQAACVRCHGEELSQVDDSHPRSKFTDPRNADRVALLDARYCATCHQEHMPRATGEMGLTLPEDYCFQCHQDIGEDRSSHVDLPFSGCAASGCHNFHDNTALYEDFLASHAAGPALIPGATLPQRMPLIPHAPGLTLAQADAPMDALWRPSRERVALWASSSHARAGVNCSDCHAPSQRAGLGAAAWSIEVPPAVCGDCHEGARTGFEAGRHGVRWAAELPAMRPAQARIEMHAESADRRLDCGSCHGAHLFDSAYASVEACLECHSDSHSLAYQTSPHASLTQIGGDSEPIATCAACHLPRIAQGDGSVRVQHNQNATLRPNEKMIRDVCIQCHSLQLSLDALADGELVRRNFAGTPQIHVESIEWASRRTDARASSTEEGSP